MTLKRHAKTVLLSASAALLASATLSAAPAGNSGVEHALGKPTMGRLIRLSSAQYRQVISDTFGSAVVLRNQLNQGDARIGGLLAIGAAQVSYSSAAFSSAADAAQSIAQQVTGPYRATLIACHPVDEKKPDDACATKFFSTMGRILWRRALTPDELAAKVQLAHAGAEKLNDFYAGVRESLAGMLSSVNFLYRVEQAEPVPGKAGVYELTPYSKASRLAALLWNSNPDDVLLTAAEQGQLDTPKGLAAQVDRMLASDKAENGLRAFFSDMLEFEKFSSLDKDPTIYPRYTATVGSDMQESLLRVLVDELLVKRVSYPDLFHTREIYLTPELAALIDVQLPLPYGASNGAPGTEWAKYVFPQGDPRAGFLTMPAFTALNAHPGKSSPTLRGKAIREDLLCQKIPDPPANVNFTAFNDPKVRPTARERLEVHRTSPTCAGCHRLMDPIGLGLENFDGSGGWRTTESGVKIDPSGSFNDVSYTTAGGLNDAVGGSDVAESCLVSRVYAYGTAKAPAASDQTFLQKLKADFANHGRQYPELIKLLATSPEFSQMTEPTSEGTTPPKPVQASTTAQVSNAP